MADNGVPKALQSSAGVMWRILVLIAGIAVLGYVMDSIFPVVFALFFALLVTAWASPVMKQLQRFLPKVVAMIGSLLLIVTLIVVILGVVIRSSINEGSKLLASINSGLAELQSWLRDGPLKLDDGQMDTLITDAKGYGSTAAKGFAGSAVDALGSLGTVVIGGSVFLFAVIFFLMAPQQVWGWLMSWMPKRARTKINKSGEIAWDSISGYTRGIVIVAICDALLVFIGLTIMQVPLAPALSALVFLGAFIPVIGAPIATFFAAIVALAERGPLIALLVIALTVVVGSFDGDVLQPLVMGKAVNLHPLAIIISIAIGSLTLGIFGALVAVPIAGAFYGVLKYLTGRDPAPTADPTPSAELAPV